MTARYFWRARIRRHEIAFKMEIVHTVTTSSTMVRPKIKSSWTDLDNCFNHRHTWPAWATFQVSMDITVVRTWWWASPRYPKKTTLTKISRRTKYLKMAKGNGGHLGMPCQAMAASTTSLTSRTSLTRVRRTLSAVMPPIQEIMVKIILAISRNQSKTTAPRETKAIMWKRMKRMKMLLISVAKKKIMQSLWKIGSHSRKLVRKSLTQNITSAAQAIKFSQHYQWTVCLRTHLKRTIKTKKFRSRILHNKRWKSFTNCTWASTINFGKALHTMMTIKSIIVFQSQAVIQSRWRISTGHMAGQFGKLGFHSKRRKRFKSTITRRRQSSAMSSATKTLSVSDLPLKASKCWLVTDLETTLGTFND